MFRHERPQKGRYRQFHQWGVEAYGMSGPEVDAELLCMAFRLWNQLGLSGCVSLQINSLGTSEIRATYRAALVRYFESHLQNLGEDERRRLQGNPLRLLDSKLPEMKPLIAAAPRLTDYLDEASHRHFSELQNMLTRAGIPYEINPTLVRGLDYYGLTVFEWVTDALGAQGTVCAGGRYDGLVAELGGDITPAVGMAAGLERLVLLLKTQAELQNTPDIYVVVAEGAMPWAFEVSEMLRASLPAMRILLHASGGSFKSQFKRADKSGATWAIIIGEEEVQSGQVTLKSLREEMPQKTLPLAELIEYLQLNHKLFRGQSFVGCAQ
jgi:histidyl-tRNA synthetase